MQKEGYKSIVQRQKSRNRPKNIKAFNVVSVAFTMNKEKVNYFINGMRMTGLTAEIEVRSPK